MCNTARPHRNNAAIIKTLSEHTVMSVLLGTSAILCFTNVTQTKQTPQTPNTHRKYGEKVERQKLQVHLQHCDTFHS